MYLFLDTETGGIDEKKSLSLLSVGAVVANDDFKVVGYLDLNLAPDDDVFTVTAQGLSVNKIDLVEHVKTAVKYKDAKTTLYEFLSWYTEKGKYKLDLVGKNVHTDVFKVWEFILSRATWEQFVSYQWIDLSGVWKTMIKAGLVPSLQGTSLIHIANYFQVNLPNHTALSDAKCTMECYQKMIEVMRK